MLEKKFLQTLIYILSINAFALTDRLPDVHFYELDFKVIPSSQSISGIVKIFYKSDADTIVFQADKRLLISEVYFGNQKVTFYRNDRNIFIPTFQKGFDTLSIQFSGQPKSATNPPWDGGLVWKKDSLGNNFIGVACQHEGAGVWWPCVESIATEPDSIKISIEVPKGYIGVSNGSLISNSNNKYTWKVTNPINIYNVSFYVSKYELVKTSYESSQVKFPMMMYALKGNKAKAEKLLEQAKEMLQIYEQLFGPYPFPEDGYKLVEAPYWGMEHQSAIAYGNNYRNNDFGFDFILVHESGHEYFGNSLSSANSNEFWIHEAFTTYAEALYLEKKSNQKTAIQYLNKQKKRIVGQKPMMDKTNTQYETEDTDIYFKGTWMLHTIRHAINDDLKWFSFLKSLSSKYKHSFISTKEILQELKLSCGIDFTPVFNHYLLKTQNPQFTYKIEPLPNGYKLKYKWENAAFDLNLPIGVYLKKGKYKVLQPIPIWREITCNNCKIDDFEVAVDLFLVDVKRETD